MDEITKHHFTNIATGKAKKHKDGSLSTVYTLQVDLPDETGKRVPTLIPSVYDGEIVSEEEAEKSAEDSGKNWPTAETHAELRKFDEKIHKRMKPISAEEAAAELIRAADKQTVNMNEGGTSLPKQMALNDQMQQMIQQDIQDAETKPKEEILQEQIEGVKTAGTFGAESTPVLGEIIAAKRTGDAIQEKDYIGAAVEAAAGVLGIVPVVGDAAGRGVRKLRNYNLKDQGSRVFHLTKKDYDAADVVGKGTDDIGFHVGTAKQASARGSSGNPYYSRAMMEDMTKGERVLPMVLKANLKPARIVDLSSFKQPSNWLANLSVDSSDRQIMKFLKGDPEDSALLKKAPRVKADGKTYIMSPDAMRADVDPDLWEDLVLEASRAKRIGLDTITKQEDRIQWFSTLKGVANKHGYDSFVYKNEYEGIDRTIGRSVSEQKSQDSYMLLEADQAKGIFGGLTEGEPEFMKNKGGVISMNNMSKQMEMFEPVERGFDKGSLITRGEEGTIIDVTSIAEDYNRSIGRSSDRAGAITGQEITALIDAFLDVKTATKGPRMNEGGLMDEGGTIDPVSGNDVPPGSTQEEVRDDIPAQLSEGEFVFPADVVRFIGLEKLMKIRQRAKAGLKMMEEMGQMGNSEEAIMPDDLPFSIEDLDMEDDGLEMAQGGVIQAANGTLATNTNTGTMNPQTNQFQPMGTSPVPPLGTAASPIQAASANVSSVNPNLAGTSFKPVTVPSITMPYQQAIGSGVRGVDYTVVSYTDKDGNPVTLHKRKDGTIVDPATNAPVDTMAKGYTLTSDVVEEAAAPKTKVQTAKVVDEHDDKDMRSPQTQLGWGGGSDPDKPGLKTDVTMVDFSILDMPGQLPGALGVVASTFKNLGKDYPSDAVIGISINGVTTSMTGDQFNTSKKGVNGVAYTGPVAEEILKRAEANAITAGNLISKYGVSKNPQGNKKIDDFLSEAAESKKGIDEIAEQFNIDLDDIKDDPGFLGFGGGKNYDEVVEAVKNSYGNFTMSGSSITEEDIKNAHKNYSAGSANNPNANVSVHNSLVNAKAAAKREKDRETTGVGPGGPGDTGPGGTGKDLGVDATGSTGFGTGTDCLTEDMKVKLNGVIDFVTNIKVGDIIDGSVVKEVLHKHMRSGYFVINNELEITNDHPVWAKSGGLGKADWTRPEQLVVGDTISGVKVTSLNYVDRMTPTVSIVIDGDSFDVYTEGNTYTVHGRYREVRQQAA